MEAKEKVGRCSETSGLIDGSDRIWLVRLAKPEELKTVLPVMENWQDFMALIPMIGRYQPTNWRSRPEQVAYAKYQRLVEGMGLNLYKVITDRLNGRNEAVWPALFAYDEIVDPLNQRLQRQNQEVIQLIAWSKRGKFDDDQITDLIENNYKDRLVDWRGFINAPTRRSVGIPHAHVFVYLRGVSLGGGWWEDNQGVVR